MESRDIRNKERPVGKVIHSFDFCNARSELSQYVDVLCQVLLTASLEKHAGTFLAFPWPWV